jgi:hypothetical protein
MTLREALKDKSPVSKPLPLEDNESFNSFDRARFYSRLFTSVKALGLKLDELLADSEKMTSASVGNPIASIPLESDEFMITSSCCSFLLMSKFAEMADSFSKEKFGEFKDTLLSMLTELKDGTLFIEALFCLLDFEAEPGIFIVLCPSGDNVYNEILEQLPENATVISHDAPLPEIWNEILKRKASTIIAFDGNIIPDAWGAPGIACIDIKTEFEKQPFERSLWTPGYQLACIDESIFKQWRDYLPLDIECKLFRDIIDHG